MRKYKAALGLLCVLCLCLTTLAANLSISIRFAEEGKGIPNAEFHLYSVAGITEGCYVLAGDFRDYPVRITPETGSDWNDLARTLEGYIKRDGLKPHRSGKTDGEGMLCFDTLNPGLYLVLGGTYEYDGCTYQTESFLVGLPDGESSCEVTVKYTVDKNETPDKPGKPETVVRRVLKVWKDHGHTAARPESIVVDLLRDGEVYDAVTLSEESGWRHTWNDLPADSQWLVVERENAGYLVEVSQKGITFVVTNTFDDPGDPGDPDDPGDPGDPDDPGNPSDPDEPGLPQTGVLWWPVPVLAVLGALLYLTGAVVERRR